MAGELAIELLWAGGEGSPTGGSMDKYTRETMVALTLARLEGRLARVETHLGLREPGEHVDHVVDDTVVEDRRVEDVVPVAPSNVVLDAIQRWAAVPPPLPPMPAPVIPAYES